MTVGLKCQQHSEEAAQRPGACVSVVALRGISPNQIESGRGSAKNIERGCLEDAAVTSAPAEAAAQEGAGHAAQRSDAGGIQSRAPPSGNRSGKKPEGQRRRALSTR